MLRIFYKFIFFISIAVCLLGCGYNHYTIAIPSNVPTDSGIVSVSNTLMFHAGDYSERNSFIDYNTLDFSFHEYHDFTVSLKKSISDSVKYKLHIDSVYVSFHDSTQPYTFDWVYNKTSSHTYGKDRYFEVRIAPIPVPEKYNNDFNLSFVLRIYNEDTNELLENKNFNIVSTWIKEFNTVLTGPCYEVQYEDYKDLKTVFGELRFHQSKIHFNEYLHSYYKGIEFDSSNYYYNLGVSYKDKNNLSQLVNIVVDSIYLKYNNADRIHRLDWIKQETVLIHGRHYTPINALVIPKSNLSNVDVELHIKIFDKQTEKLISENQAVVRLSSKYNWYDIIKTELVRRN